MVCDDAVGVHTPSPPTLEFPFPKTRFPSKDGPLVFAVTMESHHQNLLRTDVQKELEPVSLKAAVWSSGTLPREML